MGIAAALACLGSATSAGAYHDEWGRDALERATPTAAVVRPDDRARHGLEAVSESATIVSSTKVGGFDWLDAGIGAADAIGCCLAGAGSYVLVVRRRRTAFS